MSENDKVLECTVCRTEIPPTYTCMSCEETYAALVTENERLRDKYEKLLIICQRIDYVGANQPMGVLDEALDDLNVILMEEEIDADWNALASTEDGGV